MWLCGVQRHFVKKCGKSAGLLMKLILVFESPLRMILNLFWCIQMDGKVHNSSKSDTLLSLAGSFLLGRMASHASIFSQKEKQVSIFVSPIFLHQMHSMQCQYCAWASQRRWNRNHSWTIKVSLLLMLEVEPWIFEHTLWSFLPHCSRKLHLPSVSLQCL